ncbi:hypothetical protein AB3X21_22630, partial [Roseomonas mucosa]|nr:hypothetical protein [Acetobacteraceae bacterium]
IIPGTTVNPAVSGVPFGRRSPLQQGSYSMPFHRINEGMIAERRHPGHGGAIYGTLRVVDPPLHPPFLKNEKLGQALMVVFVDPPAMDVATVRNTLTVQEADMGRDIAQNVLSAIWETFRH